MHDILEVTALFNAATNLLTILLLWAIRLHLVNGKKVPDTSPHDDQLNKDDTNHDLI